MTKLFSKDRFAERLMELMESSNDTIYTLAEYLGLSPSSISKYTNGKMSPKMTAIESLCRKYSVNPIWLMGAEDVPKFTPSAVLDMTPVGELIKIPIIGTVRAGQGGIAYEEPQGYNLTAKAGLSAAKQYFFLSVKGDSMSPQIVPGDIVLVSPDEDVNDNDIAVVIVNGEEGMVKRIQKTEKGLILYSVNPEFPPRIVVEPEAHYIVGKVIKVERWYK